MSGGQPERIAGAQELNAAPQQAAEAASSGLDLATVTRVFERCQQFIKEAVSGAALPAEFLGALAANESGGDQRAARFEDWIFVRLRDVAEGWSPAFWGIGRSELLAAVEGEEAGLRDLATSWGYTQIMGYQVIGRNMRVQSLLDPQVHFRLAMELLAGYAHRFGLRLSSDFRSLFRCWNTGRPDGETFDPGYVEAGIRRMALYHRLVTASVGRMAAGKEDGA